MQQLDGALLNVDRYAEPLYYVDSSTPRVPIRCERYECIGGTTAPLTGDEVVAQGSDGQLNVVDLAGRRSWELFEVRRDDDGSVRLDEDGGVTVGSMSVVDLDGGGNRSPGGKPVTITGAGLSRIFGVIRADEVEKAATDPTSAIDHSLSVSLPARMNCSSSWRSPATKTDGRSPSAERCVQQGAHVFLPRTVDCEELGTSLSQAVCVALQRYGAYVLDNNGTQDAAFYGQHWDSWPDGRRDYARVGVRTDYQDLGLPVDRFRVRDTGDRWQDPPEFDHEPSARSPR